MSISEILETQIITLFGETGLSKINNLASVSSDTSGVEILFENDSSVYMPVVVGTVTLETYKSGRASCLNFNCMIDDSLKITEGDTVSLRFNGVNMFYGYVFERVQNGKETLSVLCYDQLRYLKNKTSLIYENKTCSQLLVQLANTYLLNVGEVQDSEYVLSGRAEEGTIFDIMANAISDTKTYTGEEFVLFDDYGSLCLKSTSSLFVPVYLDETCIKDYSYTTSIDDEVYTKVTIAKEDDDTGVKTYYTANDEDLQNKWGVLEYYETENNMEVGEIKTAVATILAEKSNKYIQLFVETIGSDERIVAGSSIVVGLKLDNEEVCHVMQTQSVKHIFDGSFHTMELDLVSLANWDMEG